MARLRLFSALNLLALTTVGATVASASGPFPWHPVSGSEGPHEWVSGFSETRPYVFDGKIWLFGVGGVFSSPDGVEWTKRSDVAFFRPSLAAHRGFLFAAPSDGSIHRFGIDDAPPEVMRPPSVLFTNSTIASHGGYLRNFGGEEVSSVWNSGPLSFQWEQITTVKTRPYIMRSEEGAIWSNLVVTSLAAGRATHVHFRGDVWAFGGEFRDFSSRIAWDFRTPHLVRDDSHMMSDVRYLTNNINWMSAVSQPPFEPEIMPHVVTGPRHVYLQEGRRLWESLDARNWSLNTEDFLPTGAEDGYMVFHRNRAWLVVDTGDNDELAKVWIGPPVSNQAEQSFTFESGDWHLMDFFEDTEATQRIDTRVGASRLRVGSVNAPGFAYLEGPPHEIVFGGELGTRLDMTPIPIDRAAAGDEVLILVEADVMAPSGAPWFRIRGNAERFERASEMLFTDLGGENRLQLSNTMQTLSTIVNVPDSAASITPYIDLLPNRDGSGEGELRVGGIRLYQIVPPEPESFITLANYDFRVGDHGFTPRTAEPLKSPEAFPRDHRGLVIRGGSLPMEDSTIFGSWGRETNLPVGETEFYKITWRVGSDASLDREMPVIRLRVNESHFRVSPMLTIVSQEGSPIPTGGAVVEYVQWFETPRDLVGGEWIFSFDLLWTADESARRADREVWLEALKVEVYGELDAH